MISTLAALISLAHVQGQVPVVWTGENSKVTKAEISVITTEGDWMRTWMRHTGQTKALAQWEEFAKGPGGEKYGYYNEINVPEVNFNSHSVVAMFGGTRGQTAGYTILDSIADGSTLIIRYVPRYYAVGNVRAGDEKKFIDVPYAFIVVPKSFSSINLEEGIIENKGKPPTKFKLVKELRS